MDTLRMASAAVVALAITFVVGCSRPAATVERAEKVKTDLEAKIVLIDLSLTRVERDIAKRRIHNWASTVEQPSGVVVVFCVDCGVVK